MFYPADGLGPMTTATLTTHSVLGETVTMTIGITFLSHTCMYLYVTSFT